MANASEMRFPDAEYLQRVEDAVGRVELKTGAEVVVSIHMQSGSYRDVDMSWGLIGAMLGLTWMIHSPAHVFHPDWLLPNVALCFVLGYVVSMRVPRVRSLLSSARRKRRQAADQALVLFHREGVDATRGQTGLLIFLSLMEGAVEVVADHGVAAVVPRAVLDEFRHRLGHAPLDRLIESLEWLGERLAEHLPIGPDDLDEIPNRARVSR